MLARMVKAFVLTHDQKTVFLAYATMIFSTAATGYLILSDAALWPATPNSIGFYDGWMILAGAIAGAGSLFIARGWMGSLGVLGALRATFGSIVMLVLAALIGGSVIMPVYGTIYAPFIVLSEFLNSPSLALIWFGSVFMTHRLLSHATARRLAILNEHELQARSSLSELSQTYFYRK